MKKQRRNWDDIIREQTASGSSVKDYCKTKGIHPNTFYKKRKIHKSRALVEITASSIKEITPIILKTRCYSLAIRNGFDPESLKSILQVIGRVE